MSDYKGVPPGSFLFLGHGVKSASTALRDVAQLDNVLDALHNLSFTNDELAEIDLHADGGGTDRWRDVATRGE